METQSHGKFIFVIMNRENREIKIRLMNEGRYDEGLKVELRNLQICEDCRLQSSHALGYTTKQTRNT